MVFSSTIFVFGFLPFTLAGYYIIHPRLRNTFLLLTSLFFYFWGEPSFVVIMLASITVNYLCGLAIGASSNINIRRAMLVLAVCAGLGLLFWYKYLDFAISTVNRVLHMSIRLRKIVLPIGISFFTFQGITYVCDVFRGEAPAQKNPLKVALYISLFPQLIAGPIVRYSDIAEQIDYRTISVEKLADGCCRFVTGLAKKAILANTLAVIADSIFNLPYSAQSLPTAWLGIICYTLQIYFDFSGYSDMAIGLGKMFGFVFLENFNLPYSSKSVREFWKRWHISLSTFFRDYVYIPLGGNRKGNTYVNLIIVFFLTGLWHGASWNFVVWGLWHGAFLIAERLVVKTRFACFKVPAFLKQVYTLLVVSIGWVLFRSENLSYAVGYLKIMFGIKKPVSVMFSTMYYLDPYNIFILILAILLGTGVLQKTWNLAEHKLNAYAVPVLKTAGVICLFAICAVVVMTSTYNPFIYFRF